MGKTEVEHCHSCDMGFNIENGNFYDFGDLFLFEFVEVFVCKKCQRESLRMEWYRPIE